MIPPRASRLSRYGDFSGILLILAGLVGYLWTEGALKGLARRAGAPGGTEFGALAEFERLTTLSRVALALAAAGIVVLLVTALLDRRAQRRLAPPPAPTPNAS